MRSAALALCAALLGVAPSARAERAPVRPETAAVADDIVHVVQKGQNLGMIARRYHTTVDAILEANHLPKGAKLRVGQKLVVPESDDHVRWRKHFDGDEGQGARGKGQGSNKESKKDEVEPKKKERDKDDEPKKARGKDKKDEGALDDYARKTTRPGYVALVRNDEKFVGQLVDARGKVIAEASKKVDRLLRSRRTGDEVKIDRRLLKLVTAVSDYFGGRSIIIVSAYRPWSPKQYTKNSRHNHGQAIDFRVVGVPARVLYDLCRTYKQVGCGYYPNSGFVHMDVRDKKTQWTDYSRSGEPPAYAHQRRRAASAATAPGRAKADARVEEIEEPDEPVKSESKPAPAPAPAAASPAAASPAAAAPVAPTPSAP